MESRNSYIFKRLERLLPAPSTEVLVHSASKSIIDHNDDSEAKKVASIKVSREKKSINNEL